MDYGAFYQRLVSMLVSRIPRPWVLVIYSAIQTSSTFTDYLTIQISRQKLAGPLKTATIKLLLSEVPFPEIGHGSICGSMLNTHGTEWVVRDAIQSCRPDSVVHIVQKTRIWKPCSATLYTRTRYSGSYPAFLRSNVNLTLLGSADLLTFFLVLKV